MYVMAVLKTTVVELNVWQRRNLVTMSVRAPQGLIQILFSLLD